MTDTTPLRNIIASFVDEAMITRIAEEYAKGRLLLIMTTNLDQGRSVIWNIGAIAASDFPGKRDLIINILRASAAIPGLFPPVMLDVSIDGTRYQEMHVDGGAVAQAFLYPPTLNLKSNSARYGIQRKRVAYILRNGRLFRPEENVKRSTLSIATQAIANHKQGGRGHYPQPDCRAEAKRPECAPPVCRARQSSRPHRETSAGADHGRAGDLCGVLKLEYRTVRGQRQWQTGVGGIERSGRKGSLHEGSAGRRRTSVCGHGLPGDKVTLSPQDSNVVALQKLVNTNADALVIVPEEGRGPFSIVDRNRLVTKLMLKLAGS